MPALRVAGPNVGRLRTAARARPVAAGLWAATSRDFGIPALRRLDASQRAPLDPAPIPLAGAPSHGWDDAGLGSPKVTGARTSGSILREAFRRGVSPETLLDVVLGAHTLADGRSPFIATDETRARTAARESHARWVAGEPLGPMDGLLVPVKDQFHLAGHPTRGGTAYLDEIHTEDAWVVRRLRHAGAIVVAKTHATEHGLNPNGVVEHRLVPRNVYSEDHGAGGSSLGAGVAVALGWCPSAVASDGGGSIRTPAALNGVFGLKPTYLRISGSGDLWGSSVAVTGPIGQTVADLVDHLEATAGFDPEDPYTAWAPDRHDAAPWRRALGRGVRGARIGVLRDEFGDADPAIASAVAAALSVLEREGATLVEVELPLARAANGIGALLIGSEACANAADEFTRFGPRFGSEMAIFMRLMDMVSASDLLLACRTRAALRRQTAALFAGVDLLALPTTARTAPPYTLDEDLEPVLDTDATAAMTRFNFLANLTGLPAGTVPVGLAGALPIGLQLVGDAWDEASVVAAMAHCERIGLHDTVPRPPGFLGLAGQPMS